MQTKNYIAWLKENAIYGNVLCIHMLFPTDKNSKNHCHENGCHLVITNDAPALRPDNQYALCWLPQLSIWLDEYFPPESQSLAKNKQLHNSKVTDYNSNPGGPYSTANDRSWSPL